jgi:hypothetical protein
MIEVRDAGPRGRGVFATEAIAEGTLLEECPVIVLPASEIEALETTTLSDYYFRWGGMGDEAAIALGFGSLYNHADVPNAMYVRKYEARMLAFFAVRAIAEGEEIVVSYNGGYGDRSPVWFDPALSSGTGRGQRSDSSPSSVGGAHARCPSAFCRAFRSGRRSVCSRRGLGLRGRRCSCGGGPHEQWRQ